ncbi:hypothetical protein EIP91_000153 [Steccherinum ochraceum]|uniref:DUF6533 domain-containing protein n=1 Tax=Steccherinum ochraceum TaxID=92696 RepID=A0A4R0RQL9_9APHY|nr:hypothetical protein EIP91_000153 [Steccherinum ochraceum]
MPSALGNILHLHKTNLVILPQMCGLAALCSSFHTLVRATSMLSHTVFLGLAAYDTSLTFSREVTSIWRRKLTVVTALFVLQRWVVVLTGLLRNLRILWVCVAAFSTLRIWAIWGHSLTPTLAVALASALVPVVNLYNDSQKTSSMVSSYCFDDVSHSLAISSRRMLNYIVRGIAIASDALVLVLTWLKTADVWRASRRMKGLKITVSTLLLRDGTVYFSLLLLLNILAMILNALQADLGGSTFVDVLNVVSANLHARFLLDLRSVYEKGPDEIRTVSTIQYAVQSLSGNMGAPLRIEDSTRVSGPADDVDHDRDQQYEEAVVPFRAGLGLEFDTEEVHRESLTSTGRGHSSSTLEESLSVGSNVDTREISHNTDAAVTNA